MRWNKTEWNEFITTEEGFEKENSVLLLSVECGGVGVGAGFKKENVTVVVGFNFDSAVELVLCGGVGVGAGFKKENVTEIVGFNFDSAVELVLCGGVGVGTGFKKENVTVVVGFNFDSAVELVLCGGVGVGTGFKKENVTVVVGFNFDSAVELVLCGGVGVGAGFKKENVTEIVGFNFDSAVELVLCGGVGVGTGFKKENVTVVVGFNFDSAVELVLCGGVSVGTGFKKENVTEIVASIKVSDVDYSSEKILRLKKNLYEENDNQAKMIYLSVFNVFTLEQTFNADSVVKEGILIYIGVLSIIHELIVIRRCGDQDTYYLWVVNHSNFNDEYAEDNNFGTQIIVLRRFINTPFGYRVAKVTLGFTHGLWNMFTNRLVGTLSNKISSKIICICNGDSITEDPEEEAETRAFLESDGNSGSKLLVHLLLTREFRKPEVALLV
ncbi:hypothetical protein PHYBLDRAFT_152484 [Phycomyces blakesleeanus NRRL 1555(-)]|uniref:Uncharacterized protein n=1 Tax=Phycomyces blakesleeanus (strain ATCC 8743b / DSM 1359 / FGSC 10004 / NBRC 33097 / NRRL 1555) TaxID=763407 RepID=A0A162TE48_PHYB8|nr:hypothetical protein PHYBLDRAFT_152484 [Phycomyces blakesleeanus NRRL 1555(-)]OAD66413.1 hypothetical protein PHYBLDRAFT_152484 [Phycomyces blakesleeanus NRRL 1555(-)]|eukprot:XP_018284453.1 hypothetical protein PHYBLDRAFT_152484 [Phycomyces blakesleeanus NRRL 1555(-)]